MKRKGAAIIVAMIAMAILTVILSVVTLQVMAQRHAKEPDLSLGGREKRLEEHGAAG